MKRSVRSISLALLEDAGATLTYNGYAIQTQALYLFVKEFNQREESCSSIGAFYFHLARDCSYSSTLYLVNEETVVLVLMEDGL